ncbi:MAG TPA: DUF4349 domain-containing protein [Anaerolineales bacterium]|nr:DUF4349 domain-containing protein [Anaerolineales bacterium]
MKKISVLASIAGLALLVGACGQALAPTLAYNRGAVEPSFGGAADQGIAPMEAPSVSGEVGAPNSAYSPGSAPADRIVIQTGSLTIVVADPAARVTQIRAMAEGMGGYVVSSYVYKTAYGTQGLTADQATITVRVPADRLDEALAKIKEGASEVRSENVSGEDVTQQYTDLQSRLRNLEAAEAQLQEIMKGATKTEDVLAVYNQLVQVRGEIESVKGQIQYYSESAALSAVTVELIPDEAAQPIETGAWDPNGVVKNAIEALIRALQWLASAAIWIVLYILPVALLAIGLPVLILVLIIRAIRRRRVSKPKIDA